MQFAQEHMRHDIRQLWRVCFGDPEAYVEAFLSHYDLRRYMVVFVEGGIPVSMLSLLPMEVVTQTGQSAGGRYIYGVATDPRYRGRGLSTRLLSYAHDLLREQGVGLSVLVPAREELFAFYQKRGFDTAFAMGFGTVDSKAVSYPQDGFSVKQATPEQYHNLREKVFGKRRMFVRWNKSDMAYRLRETAMQGGETLLLETPKGQAAVVCYPQAEQLVVKEAAVDGMTLTEVLSILGERYHPRLFSLRLPMDAAKEFPLKRRPWAMACWYDSSSRDQVLSTVKNEDEPYMNLVLD